VAEDRYLGESDWDDLDLITQDEATYRFDEELRELDAALAASPSAVEREKLEARRALVEQAKARLSQRRSFDFPKA
jgi:hypothetical protein